MAEQTAAERLLKPEEAAVFLGYSVGTIYNKVSRGELPHVKLGHALRFRMSELSSWVETLDADAKQAKEDAAA